MALEAGTRLGPYEITAKLGEGGMGVVYRATDTSLGRAVALKVLPDAVAADADRLARFDREARTLASLNHANIASIYGLAGDPDAAHHIRALVMELVEGPTLADRIDGGAIPLDEALPIAKQICEALEAAHEQGIIHRDLKPANVKVRPDGTVKVLDFGLAKAMGPPEGGHYVLSGLSQSPTITTPAMTQAGVILGTAAYMSPEQARGKRVDRRTDIWAFGCVLFEMLTGARAFRGEDATDTIASIVKSDPDWHRLSADVPARVRRVIKVCLDKDPQKRGGDISAIRLALEGAFETEGDAVPRTESGAPRSRAWGLTAAAALLSAGLAGLLVWSLTPRQTGAAPPTRFVVRVVGDMPLSTAEVPLALSPDGRDLVYAVGGDAGHLLHQSLAGFEPRAIEGSRGSITPFFSSRGDVVGFYSQPTGQLQRVELAGGSPTRLIESKGALGASWGEDGTLVFTQNWSLPLSILRPGAPKAVDLTRFNAADKEQAHLWPQILPGNRGVLFTTWSGAPTWDESQLAVADLTTGEHRIVLRGGASGRYASSGHLVFWRGNALMAVAFDLDTLTAAGEPVRVVPDVRLFQGPGGAHFAISDGGTLAYIRGKEEMFSESFVADRTGRRVIGLDGAGATGDPTFSPDGTRLALTLYRGGSFGIGVFDIGRGQVTPVSFSRDNIAPNWTAKGDQVTFVSNRDGDYNLYAIRSDGSGVPEPLSAESQGFSNSRSAWSRDGRHLAYDRSGASGWDIWVLESGGGARPRPLLATPAVESAPTFSPDGRFIAYQSDESGTFEVYVRPFPDVDTGRIVISRAGGRRPVWSRDGRNVFYFSADGLMQAPVASGADGLPRFGQPSLVFKMSGIRNFDVSPDGQTFAIQRTPIETLAREIHVVTNWYEELKRLVPAN